MRKILLALCLLVSLAPPAGAGTYQITTTAPEDVELERIRVQRNTDACADEGLGADCTQPQLRAAYCRRTADSAAPCAGSGRRVINDTILQLITNTMFEEFRDRERPRVKRTDQQTQCAWWATASAAARNAQCATWSLPNGCDPCP